MSIRGDFQRPWCVHHAYAVTAFTPGGKTKSYHGDRRGGVGETVGHAPGSGGTAAMPSVCTRHSQ